jgi:hypothetical protein
VSLGRVQVTVTWVAEGEEATRLTGAATKFYTPLEILSTATEFYIQLVNLHSNQPIYHNHERSPITIQITHFLLTTVHGH